MLSQKMLLFGVLSLCVISQCAAEGEEANKCQPNPCQNSGRCQTSPWRDRGFKCWCEGHYWGSLCEKESKCKHENPCQNGGSCETHSWEDEGYYCSCVQGYHGNHCEKVSPCVTADPCQNGARCVATSWNTDEYLCRCKPNFYGKNCSKKNPCLSGDLCNGGKCSMSNYAKDGYHCSCPEGKGGNQCQYVDPCKPDNPCQNSGRCESYQTSSGFSKYCECPKTHWGENCENETPCKEETCQNGGKCYGGEWPDCECPTGFRGRKCEKKTCPLTVDSCGDILRGGKGPVPGRGKGKGRFNPAQCMANLKQRIQRVKVCFENITGEITKLRNCDCLTQDIWHWSFSDPINGEFEAIEYCYLRSSERLKSSSCSSRIISCYETVQKAARRFRSSNCTAENLAVKRELKQCVEDYEAGHVTATGNCAPLEKVIKMVAPLIKLGEKMMCSSCDQRSFEECFRRKHNYGYSYRMTYCTMIKENEAIKKCLMEKVDANPSCSSFKDDVTTVVDFYLQELKKHQQKICERLDSFWKTRVEVWGCPAEE